MTYYSVECQTKSLSYLCVLFAMFPVFLAILKFCTIQRLFYSYTNIYKASISISENSAQYTIVERKYAHSY